MVWRLSYSITRGSSSLRDIALSSLDRYIASFAVCDRASSSASVDEVVTVSCLLALHATGPPNSFRIYPCELFRSILLSAKEVSLAYTRDVAIDS